MAAPKNPIKGSSHYRAKLTEGDVDNIRALIDHRKSLLDDARKITNKKIAEKFDVTKSCVERIASFNSWRHV